MRWCAAVLAVHLSGGATVGLGHAQLRSPVVTETKVEIPPPIEFIGNTAKLRPNAVSGLAMIASTIRSHPGMYLIDVEAPAASISPGLALRRAENAVLALVALGVDASRVEARAVSVKGTSAVEFRIYREADFESEWNSFLNAHPQASAEEMYAFLREGAMPSPKLRKAAIRAKIARDLRVAPPAGSEPEVELIPGGRFARVYLRKFAQRKRSITALVAAVRDAQQAAPTNPIVLKARLHKVAESLKHDDQSLGEALAKRLAIAHKNGYPATRPSAAYRIVRRRALPSLGY